MKPSPALKKPKKSQRLKRNRLKFIIGIGNPGKIYEKTRHNIGFRAVDALEKSKSSLKNNKICLVKPATYVNRTGEEVLEILQKHRATSADVLVVCDDVNLAFGKMRLRAKGSSGGHNGLQSVIDSIGTDEFARLRIGVKNETMLKDLAQFVLEPFSKEEEKNLKRVLERAVFVSEAWVKNDIQTAMDTLSRLQSINIGVEE